MLFSNKGKKKIDVAYLWSNGIIIHPVLLLVKWDFLQTNINVVSAPPPIPSNGINAVAVYLNQQEIPAPTNRWKFSGQLGSSQAKDSNISDLGWY